ncbi:MAG: MBL fold metallo-hydrolase [Nitrososphaerales archaeon]
MNGKTSLIAIGAFLIGLGIGYGIFAATVQQQLQNQQIQIASLQAEVSKLKGTTAGQSIMPAAPIPDAAKGPAIDPEKGYLVEEIKDGLYWVTEGAYQVMFLTTGEGVIVVDAPPTIGENVLKAIGEVTDEPITHVIYSHFHADHIAAASILPNDAVIIAHEDTAEHLAHASSPSRSYTFGSFVGGSPVLPPTVTFSDSYMLTLGSQTLELAYKGPVHVPGSIFIYAPQQKVLMLVDVVFPGWSPFKDLAMTEHVPAFIAAHDLILEYEFDTFIGGHLTRLGTPEDVKIQREYIQDIQANAATAFQTVDFFAIAEQTGFENSWLLFDTYLEAVIQSCTDATVPHWIDRLGGVDVFTDDHCFKIAESLRID